MTCACYICKIHNYKFFSQVFILDKKTVAKEEFLPTLWSVITIFLTRSKPYGLDIMMCTINTDVERRRIIMRWK